MCLVTRHPGAESSLPLGLSRNAVDGQGRWLTWDVGGRQHKFESLAHPRYLSKPLGYLQAGFGGKDDALFTISAHSCVGWERELFVSCIP